MKPVQGDVLSGFNGNLGNTGFYKRVVKGVETIQRCPKRKQIKGKKEWSEQNLRFYRAVRCAKQYLMDLATREIYAKVASGFTSPAAMFVKDYLKPAVISRVVTSGYRGRVGYRMVIRVDNVVPVKSVKVTIENREGEIIESGLAVMQRSGFVWHYRTTCANPYYRNSQITILSCDVPNHTVKWIQVL